MTNEIILKDTKLLAKRCSKCNWSKKLNEFALNGSRKDGHDTVCKSCRSRAEYERCQADTTRASKKSKDFRDDKKDWLDFKFSMIHNIIYWVKRLEGCAVTGDTEFLVFHHLNPETKLFNISGSLTRSWKSVIEEMMKCVVVSDTVHGLIHSILRGDLTLDFPPALVDFMEFHYQVTHYQDGEWGPVLKVADTARIRKAA